MIPALRDLDLHRRNPPDAEPDRAGMTFDTVSDAAERVLGDFAMLQNRGSGRQPCLHAVEHRLIGPAANPPIGIGRALRLQLTATSCIVIAVLHRRVVPHCRKGRGVERDLLPLAAPRWADGT
jgi:hypothetical protein